jgi:fumarate hydratase, class II
LHAIQIGSNKNGAREHLNICLMLATALNPQISYPKAAKISLSSYHHDLSPRDAALKLGFVTGEQFDLWVRQKQMINPLGGDR